MALMRQRLGRWWRWVMATRARRSALTLAVLAAMAAPFATKSYKAQFNSLRYVPLTEEDRTQIIARWGDDKDCEQPYQDAMKTWGGWITGNNTMAHQLNLDRMATCIEERGARTWQLPRGLFIAVEIPGAQRSGHAGGADGDVLRPHGDDGGGTQVVALVVVIQRQEKEGKSVPTETMGTPHLSDINTLGRKL